jgi:hypothetical protein
MVYYGYMATQAFATPVPGTPNPGAEEELARLTQEDIATRAYYLWEERGCPMDGSSDTDWFAAEQELLG